MKKENKTKRSKRIRKAIISSNIVDLLDDLPFYVILIDAKRHIVMANKAVSLYLQRDPKDIIGQYCPKVVHGLDEPFPGCPLEEAVKKGHPVEREFFDPRSGRWVLSRVYPTKYRTQDNRTVFYT